MASRSSNAWKSLSNRLRTALEPAISAPPRTKPYATLAADSGDLDQVKKRLKKGDFVPVCVAIGMIAVSTSLGLYTAMQQLRNSPTVRVKKSKRETLPEVVEPEEVVNEAERFISRSFFRKIAHVQDFDVGDTTISDPGRKDVFVHKPRTETLKDVGVDPKFMT